MGAYLCPGSRIRRASHRCSVGVEGPACHWCGRRPEPGGDHQRGRDTDRGAGSLLVGAQCGSQRSSSGANRSSASRCIRHCGAHTVEGRPRARLGAPSRRGDRSCQGAGAEQSGCSGVDFAGGHDGGVLRLARLRAPRSFVPSQKRVPTSDIRVAYSPERVLPGRDCRRTGRERPDHRWRYAGVRGGRESCSIGSSCAASAPSRTRGQPRWRNSRRTRTVTSTSRSPTRSRLCATHMALTLGS